ncbi:MAG TPA: hypothetical protein VGM44_17030, partial [Polyangiaceae bacterium]
MADWLDIVEAAYDVHELSHELWLTRLMGAVVPKLEGSGPPFGGIFHFPRGGQLQMFSHPSTPEQLAQTNERLAEEASDFARALLSGPAFSSMCVLAERAAARGMASVKSVRELLESVPGV